MNTYLGIRAAKQLLKMADAKVGHTNVAHLSRAHQLLHLSPSVAEIPVLVVLLLVLRVRRAGPVHEVQVHVIQPEVLQAVVDGLGDMLVPGIVQLGRHPDLAARDARGSDPFPDLLLIAVGVSRVNVAIAALKRGLDGSGHLAGLGLPCAKTHGGDLIASVEGELAAGGMVSMRSVVGPWVFKDLGGSQCLTYLVCEGAMVFFFFLLLLSKIYGKYGKLCYEYMQEGTGKNAQRCV